MNARSITSLLTVILLGSILFVFSLTLQINAQKVAKNCDSSYRYMIPPHTPDLNRDDIPDNKFYVLSPDPHGFDLDGNGRGCES